MTLVDQLRIGYVVLVALFREEWRLHVTLFGGRRFLLIPVVLSAIGAGVAVALAETGTVTTGGVVAGVHLFAIGFGLYSGTAGFAGSDMLENVFGDLSLVLGTAVTLPLSRRRTLGLFLLKDAVYYGVMFVLPMAVAAAPLFGALDRVPVRVAELWLSAWLAFVAGMVVTLSAIALRTRTVPGLVLAGAAAIGVGTLWWSGRYDMLWATLVTVGDGPIAAITLAVGVTTLAAIALAVYDPTYEPPSRTMPDRFETIRRHLPTADPLVAKSILDLGRSSGGFAKPLVSVGILFVLVAGLVGVVESITGIEPAPGVFFGAVLGLCAFTTYNWLTQFDSVEAYLIHPVSVVDIFRAKRTTFALVGAPTAIVPYLVAVVWFDATLVDAVSGAAVLVGYSLYYYGLTVAIAGFSPNEFLFDGVRFGAFSVGVGVILLPTLLAAFAVVPPTVPVALGLIATSVLAGAVGLGLTRIAASRWADRFRAGIAR